MSSANNLIGALSAYTSKSAAAFDVSNVANKSRGLRKTEGFDNILNKVTGGLSQSRAKDQAKDVRQTRQSQKEVRNNPYKTDRSPKSELEAKIKELAKSYNTAEESDENPGVVDEETLAKIAAYFNQNGVDTGALEALAGLENFEIDGNVRSKDDLLNLIGNNLQSLPDIAANLKELLATDFDPMNAELSKAIMGGGLQLFSNVTEELELPAEDVMNAMQTLGLMAMDLLNPQNMQQLVTKLSGGEQGIDLITDSDIYTSLQDLMEGAESMNSELMNEFDLSEEGLQSAINDTKEQFANMLQQNMAEGSQDNTQADASELSLEEMIRAREERLSQREEKLRELLNSEDAPWSEAFSELVPEEKTEQVSLKGKSLLDDHSQNFRNGAESTNLFNQLMNKIADAAMEAKDAGQASYTDRAQMQDIIRQITDRITISAGSDETSMELALHPASLGNVNILLTSGKDGIVAKFTAQNQIVKEAVETQMVQLQQKFDEQGIKVTSIEVTIASHGFEQNLDQEGGRQPRNTGDEKKVKPLRRINLSEIDDELVQEMNSDAEKIAMQMMAANGNSVDFSA